MADTTFAKNFEALTGHPPFPWQVELYKRFISECDNPIPPSASLPTGLGKTNVIAVWLIALAHGVKVKVPRRLVYVVNRRTVVDQTTREAEKLLDAVRAGKIPGIDDLAISTLRGQFADNRAWSADPSRPAIIVGTVDMIGSRLLFSGYGVGFRSRPLHAGFLGQDALLVHDEAHLEPAFQTLITDIEKKQTRERECNGELPWPKLRIMQLTATTRNGTDKQSDGKQGREKPFELTDEEKKPPDKLPDQPTEPIHHVWRRLKAKKTLTLHPAGDGKDTDDIAGLALKRRWVCDENDEPIKEENGNLNDANAAVLVFVRTLDDVKKVSDKLADKKTGVGTDHVRQLTGTMRGLERDRMTKSDPVFMRFLPGKSRNPDVKPAEGTVYLVCTSAGEVGIDISADHMVCDLSTFESMAQRFGRVNRYGYHDDTRIDVVYPATIDDKNEKVKAAREATLKLLRQLDGDASPLALSQLDADERAAAFAPEPTIPPATDILFDAWALTSIRKSMPGRPPVEPYLHGIAEWEPLQTHVAWREEVEIITGDLLERHTLADLLDDYPLRPHELLRDSTDRKRTGVFAELTKIAQRVPDATVWIIDAQGDVKPDKLRDVVEGNSRRLHSATVVLPPSTGGLTAVGTLDGDVPFAKDLKYDVADITDGPDQRIRIHPDDPDRETKLAKARGMRRVLSINLVAGEDEDAEPRTWDWFEQVPEGGGRTAKAAVLWKTHVDDVVHQTEQILGRLDLPAELREAVVVAARLHDHGKKRERFQLSLGNRDPSVPLAKSDRRAAVMLRETFRHEFGSLLDAQANDDFKKLRPEMQDLVLHLIAAHHGRARPHFDLDEAFDPERLSTEAEALAMEAPRRFARLQRKYGRWGLAYLESLLRAADWAASAKPSKVLDANGNEVTS